MSIVPDLGYCLSYQDVEPVERFGLVMIDIIICF